jgi:hypothetical protein
LRHYAHLCDRTLANAVNALLPAFGATEESNVAAIRAACNATHYRVI